MTRNKTFKRRVRERAAKTGESYTAALRHLRKNTPEALESEANALCLAVAQTSTCDDPRNIAGLRASGLEMRRLMREARETGARLVHFPEGTICSPNKRVLSVDGPDRIGPSDWDRVAWSDLRAELDAVRILARELELWTVFGSVHQLTLPQRPHNSLYVVSDRGELVTRYDERMLSNTKISFMYTPGAIPMVFEAGGFRFGCALGMEAHFPEIFLEYERLDVDCVLFSTTGGSTGDTAFAAEVQGHAASNSTWVSLSVHARPGQRVSSGIAAPGGQWAAQCAGDGTPSIAISDLYDTRAGLARPWRRLARTGIYEPYFVDDDPRSERRDRF